MLSRPRARLHLALPLALAAGLLVASSAATLAQTTATPEPLLGDNGKPLAFATVSIHEIKHNPTSKNPAQYGLTPDAYHLFGPSLAYAIRSAYPQSPGTGAFSYSYSELLGAPRWLDKIRYEIVATISPADLPQWRDPARQPAMARAMLQAMLSDRFELAVHRETKVLPVYTMTVAKGGPTFKAARPITLAEARKASPTADPVLLFDGAIIAPGPDPAQIVALGITMPALATDLRGSVLNRPVIDRTGLTGKYDLTYQILFSPLNLELSSADGIESQILDLLRKQLGLEFQRSQGPVEFLIIDHIEPPTPD